MRFLLETFKRDIAFLLTLAFIAAACNAAFGVTIKNLLENFTQSNYTSLMSFICMFAAIRFLIPIVNGSLMYFSNSLGFKMEAQLRRVMFAHIVNLEYDQNRQKNTGEIQKKLQEGVLAVRNITQHVFLQAIPTILGVVLVFFITTWLFGYFVSAMFLFLILSYMSFIILLTKRRLSKLQAVSKTDGDLAAFTHDKFLNNSTAKLFDLTEVDSKRHDRLISKHMIAKQENNSSLLFVNLSIAIFSSISSLILLMIVSKTFSIGDVASSEKFIGVFLMFSTYLFQIFLPLNSLAFSYRQILTAFIEVDKLKELLRLKVETDHGLKKIDLNRDFLALSIEHAIVKFGSEKAVIDDMSCKLILSRGRICIITGKSGAGKTTFIMLLLGLVKLDHGSLLINGVDSTTISKKYLRSMITVATQDTALFNESIKENLLYANAGCSDEELYAHLNAVGLEKFASTEGLNFVVGERGQLLSGGEKLRIGIARAIIKNSDLIIFDEPTSNMDSANKEKVVELIQKISQKRLVLVVTHDQDFIDVGESCFDVYHFPK